MSSSELAGLRILIVEDNPIISLDVAETLADAGAIVIGPAHTVTQALKLVDGGGLDAAVLDYRLEQRFHRRLPTGWGASPCLTFSHQFVQRYDCGRAWWRRRGSPLSFQFAGISVLSQPYAGLLSGPIDGVWLPQTLAHRPRATAASERLELVLGAVLTGLSCGRRFH